MPRRRKKPVQESGDTRAAVLKAAELLFAQKGYLGARVAEIADEAGVDKRLVFYYFGTKHGLYAEILESFFRGAEPLLEAFLRKRGQRPDPSDVDRFMENMTLFIQQNHHSVRILFREFLDGGVLLEDFLDARVLPLFRLWRTYYPGLFPGTQGTPKEADHMLLTLSGMNLFYFLVQPLMERVWQEDPLQPERIEERKAFLRRYTRGRFR